MVKKKQLKDELLKRVNKDSQVDLEKVDRYLSLWETYTKLATAAKKNPIIIVKNGSQEYTKTNPAVNDMNRINNSLISLGKDMGLDFTPTIPNAKDSSADDSELI